MTVLFSSRVAVLAGPREGQYITNIPLYCLTIKDEFGGYLSRKREPLVSLEP
jgi:hypothetical protein